jgi:hypothetical protein
MTAQAGSRRHGCDKLVRNENGRATSIRYWQEDTCVVSLAWWFSSAARDPRDGAGEDRRPFIHARSRVHRPDVHHPPRQARRGHRGPQLLPGNQPTRRHPGQPSQVDVAGGRTVDRLRRWRLHPQRNHDHLPRERSSAAQRQVLRCRLEGDPGGGAGTSAPDLAGLTRPQCRCSRRRIASGRSLTDL